MENGHSNSGFVPMKNGHFPWQNVSSPEGMGVPPNHPLTFGILHHPAIGVAPF